ncbi:MAG: choice-of-anchor J domain-containing protein [Flavobacteriaceae bacterium]|jgi:gliding motility-associated-like protein|nr:choice-of-anchor J domain-containing protein [Flavobacteriaceae bacterium]
MSKKIIIFWISLLGLITTYAFQSKNITQFINRVYSTNSTCVDPSELVVKNRTANSVIVKWNGQGTSQWEYVVQQVGLGTPSANGVSTQLSENKVTTDVSGNVLSDDTMYEYYVRSVCSTTTYSNWVGPYYFKTLCLPITIGTTTFTADFNLESDLQCWTIVDEDKNENADDRDNIWRHNMFSTYEGNGCVSFSGNGKPNNDWLISPTFSLSGGIYELSYYYRTDKYDSTDFEIVLSTNGIETSEFTTTIMPATTLKTGVYTYKKHYIKNITGNINIAWHVITNGSTMLYLDQVQLKKVNCVSPDPEIEIFDLQKDKASFSWIDDTNTSWEYYTQLEGKGQPLGSGSLSSKKTVTVTKTNGTGAANLLPGTTYEFYVRGICTGNTGSNWIGPIKFKTPCVAQALPFWEGFNTGSTTLDCWNTIDGNRNGNGVTEEWTPSVEHFEGDLGMGYEAEDDRDDWLITPTFTLNPTKYYRLKYHYQTNPYVETDFEVVLSKTGIAKADFKKQLISHTKLSSDEWTEERLIITGISGDVNIAWHANGEIGALLYIDNVFFEEVDCPEPMQVKIKDITSNSASIYWQDEYSTQWEYVVQKATGNLPVGNGTSTTKKDNVVTKDQTGALLDANTAYEYFVRTVCGGGKYSEWLGPFQFRTLCNVINTPFWEGFNSNSQSIYCWSIIDQDANPNITDGKWNYYSNSPFEGDSAVFYSVFDFSDEVDANDWLVSPTFNFTAGKQYRLKYHYKTEGNYPSNSFEVLASNSGTQPKDFKTEVVENKNYTNQVFLEQKAFITNLSGQVNLAWHVKGTGSKEFIIDNVFVEEVNGCIEPQNIGAKDLFTKQATLMWEDEYKAKNWEFFVQPKGGGTPKGSGTPTAKKENIVTKDNTGKTLTANTAYEYYVRTVCGNGAYSIWEGPFVFYTACDIYKAPFKESFNSTSTSLRCWTVLDLNNDATESNNSWRINTNQPYEGDQMYMFTGEGYPNNDWLVSPAIDLDASMYVLKYRYRAEMYNDNFFQVSMSYDGLDETKFTTPLVTSRAYTNDKFQEEVVFFTAKKGVANIAWQVVEEGYNTIYIDQVSIEKVTTCPEPYYVEVTGQTATTIDVEWQQQGGITDWEVIAVAYGEAPTSTPVVKQQVQGTPKTTLSGLQPGTLYSIYVKAKCSGGTTFSNWSTVSNTGTAVGVNDDCNQSVTIPVNADVTCNQYLNATTLGATESINSGNTSCEKMSHDVWYEFTATSDTHLVNVNDIISLSGVNDPVIYASIYDQMCAPAGSNAIACYSFSKDYQWWLLENLVPNKKYFIRLGASQKIDFNNTKAADYFFKLCITSSKYKPMEIIPQSSTNTAFDMINDVLISSNCDLVSNVKYQNGDGGVAAQKYNTLGLFNRKDAKFPFEKGIVLSTNEIQYVSRPFRGATADRGNNNERWVGDKDINDAINDAGGSRVPRKRVTQVEFDFIPVKDSIKFDYLFASNSYHRFCGEVCTVGALFAAWLIDTTTGEGQNLAKVPGGSNKPIAINTIRDVNKSKAINCGSENPEYFGTHYDQHDSPLEAPADFAGMTVPMSSETVHVVPGRKYHIKLAVIDFCTQKAHSSAVFFNAGSFDLGNLNLGADMLVETGNALCVDEKRVIKSGVLDDPTNVVIEWKKDGVVIPNANQSTLEVSESGKYTIKALYKNINCPVEGDIQVEMYKPIHEVVNKPNNLNVCRLATTTTVPIDLTAIEADMFTKSAREKYVVTYFEQANEKQPVADPKKYEYTNVGTEKQLYVRVEDAQTGCSELFDFKLIPTKGEEPQKREDIRRCLSYQLPQLNKGEEYYELSGGKGKQYKGGDVLYEGAYTIFVLKQNGGGCYEETSFTVEVYAMSKAQSFDDQVLTCKLYVLEPLPKNNKYYTEVKGRRVELQPGTSIPLSGTKIWVVGTSDNGFCTNETSFTVTYEECPIPKGFSPNGDGINDVFDLSLHGVTNIKVFNRLGIEVYSFQGTYTNQWNGKSNTGKDLPSGTYYYVIQAYDKTKTGWVEINR